MAVTKTTRYVKAQNATGWDLDDVMTALEGAFADAGYHGSSVTRAGSVVNCCPPGSTSGYKYVGYYNDNWKYCSNPLQEVSKKSDRRYKISHDGNSPGAFVVHEEYHVTNLYGSALSDQPNDNFLRLYNQGAANNQANSWQYEVRHTFQTGDAVKFTTPNDINQDQGLSFQQLTHDTIYYVIVPPRLGNPSDPDFGVTLPSSNTLYGVENIQLAATLADAQAGNAIQFTYDEYQASPNCVLTRTTASSQIDVRRGDLLYLRLSGLTGHPVSIVDTQDNSLLFNNSVWDATSGDKRELNSTNFYGFSYRMFPESSKKEVGTLHWNVRNQIQGTYYLACTAHEAMAKVPIVVAPGVDDYAYSGNFPFWDYDVPADGSKESIPLRVYRLGMLDTPEVGGIYGVKIRGDVAPKGWSTGDSFTIPGSAIGGGGDSAGMYGITFGVNSNTNLQQSEFQSKPSIVCDDIGSGGGTNFFQKMPQTDKAILEITNDSNKTYGTTYYGFKFTSIYQIQVTSGYKWEYLNWNPEHTTDQHNGQFVGEPGFDYWSGNENDRGGRYFVDNDDQNNEFSFASGTNAAAYPLEICTYKADSGQDSDFAIINFVQIINNKRESQFTFFLHKGTTIGNNIWDLDDVFQGGITVIDRHTDSTPQRIRLRTYSSGRRYSLNEEKNTLQAIRREALYGYMRNVDQSTSGYYADMSLANNLYEANNVTSDVVGYYREANHDRVTNQFNQFGINSSVDTIDATDFPDGTYTDNSSSFWNNLDDTTMVYGVPSTAYYYKPIKGIPINNSWAPIPYFLPDDYVAIPFIVTPGATTFHQGDSITISNSEIYEIIEVDYVVNQETYDGVTSNTCKGIAFCARTT